MFISKSFAVSIGVLCIASMPLAANATVVGISPNADLTDTPYTIDLENGAAVYTFSNSGVNGGFFGNLLPAVQTGGSAMVASDGPPFHTDFEPATYFTDPGRQPFIDDSLLATFTDYGLPTPFDAETDSFVALRFELSDGVHFGFARIAGLTLYDFAYETDPGVGIQAELGPFASLPGVPEPATILLLGSGILGVARLRRRKG